MIQRSLIPVFAVILCCVSPASGVEVYVIARESYNVAPYNRYQFGRFDIDSPNTSGGAGNYVYPFVSIGTNSSQGMMNLAFNPTNATMYLTYDDTVNIQYRSITKTGTMSANLGISPAQWGMSFDNSGNLYGTEGYGPSTMMKLNASTGVMISSNSTTSSLYSSYAGNMAWFSGQYYFANEDTYQLVTIGTNGTVTSKGAFAGTGYDNNLGHTLFAKDAQLYMLNGLNLYNVNVTNGALGKLGSISGVAGDTPSNGFAGAVVPEPSSLVMAVAACFMAVAIALRRRLRSRHTIRTA